MLRGMKLLHTAHVPPGDGPFPTIVALHGWGASAHDLIGLAPILDAGRSLVLCPQGPVAFQAGPGAVGYGWFPLTAGGPPDPEAFREGADAVQEFIDEATAHYPIDPRKLVLVGFSQGGVMAYEQALRNPSRYAALVALSSWLPDHLAASIAPGGALENLLTLVLHGTEDPMIPIDRARASREALAQLGVPFTYREYEMGHEINPDALRELLTWLDEKILHPVLLA